MNGWQIFVEVPGHAPVELKPGESIIGRSRTSQVHIPESTVSRQHARLVVGGLGEVGVEDLGSSNGTFVNGEKVEGRRKLKDGDRILIGDAELRVRIVAPVAAAEATVRMVLPPLGPPPAQPMAPLPIAAPPLPPTAAPAAWPPPPLEPSSPRVTASIATQPPPPPSLAPSPSWASAPPVPPRPIDPPLRLDPPRAPPAPPSPAPLPAAKPAAPPPPSPVAPVAPPGRRDVLPSVTAIDRIPIPEPALETLEAARLARAKPAGFWVRVVAMLVDSALLGVVSVAIGALGFFAPLPPGTKMAIIYGLVTGLGLAYPLIFWALRGATPGKMLLGLAVVVAGVKPGTGIGWGPAIVRALGYVASGLLFGIGFLLVAFTSQKQGLHDLIAGTRVLRLR